MFLHLSGPLVAGPFVAAANILDTSARLHPLHAIGLNILVGLNGPVGRDRPVRLDRLVVLDMSGFACLDALNILVALDSLDSLHALCAFAELHGAALRPTQGLDALEIPSADIAELLLEIRVLERRVAMHRVEPPGLPGDGSNGAPVKSAVEDGVGLDRCEAGMPPVVAVP